MTIDISAAIAGNAAETAAWETWLADAPMSWLGGRK